MSKAKMLLQKLEKRLSELEHLLPSTTPTDLYPQDTQDKMLGYRLLAHAEIEGFIEALANLTLTEIWNKPRNGGPLTEAAIAMVEFRKRLLFPPRHLTKPPATDINVLREAVSELNNKISTNNGITEKDILKLFLPLGVDLTAFNTSWLISLNALGEQRGDVAHNSWENATYSETTPATEKASVTDVLQGLSSLVSAVEVILGKV